MSLEPPAHAVAAPPSTGWRVLPMVWFGLMIVSLGLAALLSLVVEPRHPRGLPDDAGVRTAAERVSKHVPVRTGGLRFMAALFGGETIDAAPDPDARGRLAEAAARLAEARQRQPREPRLLAALAHTYLARHELPRAERLYRAACELTPHYGEARLGLGIALALRGDVTTEPLQARSQWLKAAAQFAMVDRVDPAYDAALFNRAVVLARAGRQAEAERFARRFYERDSVSAIATSLREALAR